MASWKHRPAFLALLSILVVWLIYRRSKSGSFWASEQIPVASAQRQQHVFQEDIQVGQISSNCGLPEACGDDAFPVFLSTGINNEFWPELCISGKYIIRGDINGGGRGLNAAIIEPNQFQVVALRNFDTYIHDSAMELDIWLSDMLDNDILIIFSTDEASARLNHSTRAMLNSLGSGKVQDLNFRAQWYLITQKGRKGFSVFEKLNFPRTKSWGDTLEFSGCVPRKIPKQPVTVDPPARDLSARDHFCTGKTDDVYQPICTQQRFQILAPALLTNRSLIGNVVYSTPIYLFLGNDFEIAVAALDSIVHQPGVLISAVTVVYNNNTDKDFEGLSKLYNVKSHTITKHMNFEEASQYAKELNKLLFPTQVLFIVISENTIPSPDFLYFLAQTAPIMLKDPSISAISTWSPNCYQEGGDVHLAFRIHERPRFAALFPLDEIDGDILAPDVSRVQGTEACHPPSLRADNWIERPQDLTQERYFHKLVLLQQRSQVINPPRLLSACSTYPFSDNSSYVVYYQEKDTAILNRLLGCLGVVKFGIGRYQGIIRVTNVAKSPTMIIGSSSSFYKARPINL